MNTGEKIRRAREELGMSQDELARATGYTDRSSIAKVETNKVDLPQSKIIKFAEVLGLSVPYLMGCEERPAQTSTKGANRMNTITIELCQEDRARLDAILQALTTRDCGKCVEGVARYVSAMSCSPFPAPKEVAPETVNTPEPEEPAQPAPEPEKAPETVTVNRADVQRKVVELSAAGKKAEARGIVTAYASNVSGIPEDKLPDVWQQLIKLED